MKLLQKHFDIALETPDGIKKLRALILTLAMQGKLVKQDPKDQPASELLKEIEAEKQRLVKEGKIRKQEPLLPIKPDDIPYKLPNGWEFVQLGEISSLITKGSSPNWQGVNYTDSTEDILFITSENVDNYKLKLKNKKYVEKKFNEIEPRSILQKYDLLMNIVGASIGRVAYYDLDEVANINQAVCLIRLLRRDKMIDFHFLLHFLNSPICISYMFDKQVDNARANLSMSNISKFFIPLPPFAEQKRIVARIDQLMALCDKLEVERNARDKKQLTVHAAAINRLLAASEQSDFDKSWQFIVKHFSELYAVSANVAELKKVILQLAVMGKLVPQNPKDQPASELLKEIEAEKQRLVKAGKIRKQEPLPPIKPGEIPYEMPTGWEWKRLGTISNVIAGNSFNSQDFTLDEGTKCIKITNAGVHNFIETNDRLPSDYIGKYNNFIVQEGNLIIALTRPFIKEGLKVCVCPSTYHNSLLNQRVAAIKGLINKSGFIFQYLKTEFVLNSFQKRFGNIGLQPNLKMNDLTDLLIPLPPLAEQKRIVARIDQLMALCDALQQQLAAATGKQTAILDAVLSKI